MKENEKNTVTELTEDELSAAAGGAQFIPTAHSILRCDILPDSPEGNARFEAFCCTHKDTTCKDYVAKYSGYSGLKCCLACIHILHIRTA